MDERGARLDALTAGERRLVRALLVTASTDVVAGATRVLHERLSADVIAEPALSRAQERLEGVDLVLLDVPDMAAAVLELRRLAPAAAILAVGRDLTPTPGGDGPDGMLDLDQLARADDALVSEAIMAAIARRSDAYEVLQWQAVATHLLEEMDAAALIVDGSGAIVAGNQLWRELAQGSAQGSYYAVCQSATGTDDWHAQQAQEGVRRVLAGEVERFSLDYPCQSPNEERWYRLQATALPSVVGALLRHVDVSVEAAASGGIGLHDPLTGLANRQLLHDRLTQALAWAARVDQLVVVAGFDLDRFTQVNDTWGHAAGDELLRQVAVRVEQLTSGSDTTARAGVDEFDVVHPGVPSTERAVEWAQELATAFDEPFVLSSATVVATASTGVYVAGAEDTADNVLRNLDAAVRAARHDGRGRLRLWTDELGRGAETRLRTEHELRQGIEAGQFELHYQPVVDLRRRKVVGVEALLRWSHPEGIRLPDTFIQIAEDTGLIVPLGGWVVEQACRQAASWAGEGLVLDMAVNLSARQVSHPDTIATIERALAGSRLDPYRLMIEVTETAVVEDAESAQVALDRVAALGARVAIDDFGTGYSSLLYLKRYPIQALKVDRSFVSGMGISDDDDAIVASVVSLARAVGAVCIAEGVETEQQHAALLALGCQLAQGFLFGRPVSAADLPELVAECDRQLQRPLPREATARARRQPRVGPDVVRRIEQLHAEGASLHTIAAALNKEGAPTDHGGRWVSATVARVIARRPR